MTRPYRFLSTIDKPVAIADPPSAAAVESDFVVILAALLCALVCAVGLISVARCAWLRRASVDGNNPRTQNQLDVANKGLKKKVIEVIPKFTYDSKKINKGSNSCGKLLSNDCAICLTEYIDGDEIRVLPQCGHGFHVGCIDMWLGSHSSCPSCRQVLVTVRCETCGEFPTKSIANKDGQHSSSSSSSSDYLP